MILINPNIQAFLSVAELGSVSAAARRLSLTQTGVTQRIKAVEREAGITLFTRSRSGMRLTPEGQSFLRYCLDAKGLEDRLAAELGRTGQDHEVSLTLVGPANLVGGRVAHQCRHIFDKWPKLNLRFSIDSFANRLNRLKQGSADLAILQVQEISPELDSKILKPLEYVLVCTARWKERSLENILENERLYAYNDADSMGFDYLKLFDKLQHLKRARLFANEDQVLQTQLVLGVGYGLLPRELAKPLVAAGKLIVLNNNRSLKVKMALAWYYRSEMPPYFREIVRSIS